MVLRYFLKLSGWLITLLGLTLAPAKAVGQGSDLREYQIKAAFIYNFAVYVEWPTEQKPRTVCTLGADTFAPALETISGKVVKNQTLMVRRIAEIEDAGACDILFIGRSERINLPSILDTVRNRPVLTISDMERFTHAGGMIGLLSRDNKVLFEINLKRAQQSQLKVSCQLLKLARDVIE